MKITFPSFLLSLIIIACKAQSPAAIGAPAFKKAIEVGNVQVLDVRTSGEFRSGHLINSLQADWNNPEQFKERTDHLDKAKPIYVYCLSGVRSAAAANWLREKGYSVTELAGGINAWKSQDYPLESKTSPTKQMSTEEYQAAINSNKIILVDIGAEWCPPCKKMEPVLESLLQEFSDKFKLVKVDGGNDIEIMKKQNVEALPVFIIYKDGKEVWRKQGIVSKEELVSRLNN